MSFFPRLAVERPVLTGVILIVAIAFGLFSLTGVQLELLPDLNFPVAVVATSYAGAGPAEVEAQVTRPLEEALATLSGVERIQSISAEGSSLIILEFDWGKDLVEATREMREAVDRVRPALPEDGREPRVLQFDPGQLPIIILGVAGPEDPALLQEVAEERIVPRLERVSGVASVRIDGGREPEIEVRLDAGVLRTYGLTLDQVAGVLRAHNIRLPGGLLDEGGRSYTVRTDAQFASLEEIRDVRLPIASGGTVRLGDVAEVRETMADTRTITRMDGAPSLGLSVLKESDANTVQVSGRIARELNALADELPPGFRVVTVMDQAEFILQSIRSVVENTLIGAVLAVAVLMAFLRNLRSTLVVALAIPFSVVASFTLISLAGLSMNLISLGGLALGVGMMVDNAIVVLESIFRKRQEGSGARVASLEGAREVGAAVVAGTLTTVAVFLPVVFIQGFAAEIFRDLALTVSFSLAASLLMALTAVPLMTARFFRAARLHPAAVRGQRTLLAYQNLLRWSLLRRRWLFAALFLLFGLGVAAAMGVGAEFLPPVDEGQVLVQVQLPPGSSLDETNRLMTELERFAATLPEVESVFTYVGTCSGEQSFGGGIGGTGGRGELQVMLVERSQRQRSSFDIGDAFRSFVADLPGAEFTVIDDTSMGGGGGGFGGPPISILLRGDDLDTLESLAAEVMAELEAVEGTREVRSSLEPVLPELNVQVDRERAAALGIAPAEVAQALRAAMEGDVATRYRPGGRELDVRVRLTEASVSNREALHSLPIRTPTGRVVPLGEIAEIREGLGPVSITRSDQARAVEVTADIESGRPLGEVMMQVRSRIDDLPLPGGYTLSFGGEAELMEDAFVDLLLAALMGFLLMYLILAAQFESYVFPIAIIVTVPMALLGAVFSLWLTGRTFNTASLIGIIMLMGVIVNNAIVLIDTVQQRRREGMGRTEAILEAGTIRLRPVLMTALTTILGMFPLALGVGEGSEIQAPLATVVMGGLLFGTLLTLVVLPAVYAWLDDLFGRWMGGGAAVTAAGAPGGKDA